MQDPEGWRRYPAALGGNGRVRPGYVQVNGQQVCYPVGTYEVRLYEGSRLKYKPVGDQASEALAELNRIERERSARNMAEAAGVQVVEDERPRAKLADMAKAHAEDALKRRAKEAAEVSHRVARQFLKKWPKTYVDDVTMQDIYAFHADLRRQKKSDRTVANEHSRLSSILRFAGADMAVMPPRPKFEKKLPTVYEPEETGAILRNADARLHLVLSVGLMCGLREQELMHLQWSDIHKRDRVLRVQSKPQWDFKVKDSEERDVPVPDDLFDRLKTWHEVDPDRVLLFPGKRGKPDGHLLRQLKTAARRAGLNCGSCSGCFGKAKECRRWTLHKLRRSYMTNLLRGQVDLRTVQAYAGHSDLASTMRYLRPASGAEARAKVNAIRWTD